MAAKQDTPIKPYQKIMFRLFTLVLRVSCLLTHLMKTNEYEILASNKNLSDSQTTQFEELKNNLKQVSSQITDLKAESFMLRDDLETLHGKMAIFESTSSSLQSHEVVSQVLYATFEHERCSTNLIAYGIPHSTSSSIPDELLMTSQKLRIFLGHRGFNSTFVQVY